MPNAPNTAAIIMLQTHPAAIINTVFMVSCRMGALKGECVRNYNYTEGTNNENLKVRLPKVQIYEAVFSCIFARYNNVHVTKLRSQVVNKP